ncbi:hypothetical protein ACF1BN_24625 [Streptomyces sp. NPDC014861]|uniref:hypothetical protein n=1 Tax=Streptomyces sp. NPDC014861 TaxID=3364923 RepID=UPI003700862F
MKKPLTQLAAVAAAAAAALALTAAPASAVPSTVWTVTPNPANITAVNSGNAVLMIELVKGNGIAVTCSRTALSGGLRNATGNPATVGAVDTLALGAPGAPCTSVLGRVTFAPAALPWPVVAEDHHTSTGTTRGHLAGVDLRGTMGACVFRVRGRLPLTHTNATGGLTLASATGDLTVVSQNGCGDAAPVGAGLILRADHLVKATGTALAPTIVGSHP